MMIDEAGSTSWLVEVASSCKRGFRPTRAVETSVTILIFFAFIYFRVTSLHGTDGRTNRRTCKTRNEAYRTVA